MEVAIGDVETEPGDELEGPGAEEDDALAKDDVKGVWKEDKPLEEEDAMKLLADVE